MSRKLLKLHILIKKEGESMRNEKNETQERMKPSEIIETAMKIISMQSEVIDELYKRLCQHETVAEIEQSLEFDKFKCIVNARKKIEGEDCDV